MVWAEATAAADVMSLFRCVLLVISILVKFFARKQNVEQNDKEVQNLTHLTYLNLWVKYELWRRKKRVHDLWDHP